LLTLATALLLLLSSSMSDMLCVGGGRLCTAGDAAGSMEWLARLGDGYAAGKLRLVLGSRLSPPPKLSRELQLPPKEVLFSLLLVFELAPPGKASPKVQVSCAGAALEIALENCCCCCCCGANSPSGLTEFSCSSALA
jgi:hypothetical protein